MPRLDACDLGPEVVVQRQLGAGVDDHPAEHEVATGSPLDVAGLGEGIAHGPRGGLRLSEGARQDGAESEGRDHGEDERKAGLAATTHDGEQRRQQPG